MITAVWSSSSRSAGSGVGVGVVVGVVTAGEGTAAVDGVVSVDADADADAGVEPDGACAPAAPVGVPNHPGWNIQTPTAATTTMVKTATLTARSRWLQLLSGFAMCED
jgi:hypothetical protein